MTTRRVTDVTHEPGSSRLSVYTIFERPTDYPDEFVCRRFESNKKGVLPCEVLGTGKTLEEVRRHVPTGLHRLDRNVGDDPNIVETWL